MLVSLLSATLNYSVGQDSSVGIATCYLLDGPGIEFRRGASFSTPVQTGPGAHPASCTLGIGSFPGVRRPGRGVKYPPHLLQRLKGRAIHLLPRCAFMANYFTFFFYDFYPK